ncbi:MAG: flavin reductase family protein [Lachnospiraceae bacterium]|nr:flavin reductase family protein [Lachnospiraceae bacterium]
MAKEIWKPGNMLYPIPAVMVTVADNEGNDNIITIAWTGTVCSDPALAYISVRPSRHSYKMIEETGEFVINLTTKDLAFATDYCGVKSGRDVDKFKECKLTREKAKYVKAPLIAESPVNIECKVIEKREYGTHHMFVGEVLAVHADKKYMDETGKFDLGKANPLVYSHGCYYETGEYVGKFGYSVQKKRK